MYKEERATFIFSQSVAALCKLEAMKALNKERESEGKALAYGEEAFEGIIEDFGIGHNTVVSFLND